jgi:signal transduction histidine kinase
MRYPKMHTEEYSCFSILENLHQLIEHKEKLEKHLEVLSNLLISINNAVPDMIWAKDLEGKYIYANDNTITKLLFDKDPIGKTDLELSQSQKLIVGSENHTFGEVCRKSDLVVLETKQPQKFLEYGKVCGKEVYLEVNKNILKNNKGEIIGVCGTGRDITEYYLFLINIANRIHAVEDIEIKAILINEINRYKYND